MLLFLGGWGGGVCYHRLVALQNSLCARRPQQASSLPCIGSCLVGLGRRPALEISLLSKTSERKNRAHGPSGATLCRWEPSRFGGNIRTRYHAVACCQDLLFGSSSNSVRMQLASEDAVRGEGMRCLALASCALTVGAIQFIRFSPTLTGARLPVPTPRTHGTCAHHQVVRLVNSALRKRSSPLPRIAIVIGA